MAHLIDTIHLNRGPAASPLNFDQEINSAALRHQCQVRTELSCLYKADGPRMSERLLAPIGIEVHLRRAVEATLHVAELATPRAVDTVPEEVGLAPEERPHRKAILAEEDFRQR